MLLLRKILAETAFCVLVLLLVPLAMHGRALLAGGVPLDLKPALFQAPWQEARPAGLENVENSFTASHGTTYYPWYRFMNDAVQNHKSLLWNPLEGFGAPFLAVWRTRVLSPFSLPVLLLPLNLGITLSLLLKLAVAGCAAFYASRRFGLSSLMALTVGVAYQLSGPVFLRAADPMGDVMPWFPLLLVAFERLLLGDLRMWPLGATLVTLMAFGGDPGSFAATGLFTLFYLLARCCRDWRGFYLHHAASGWLAIWAMGLFLASVQLWPYVEFQMQGSLRGAGLTQLFTQDAIALLAPPLLDPTRPEDAAKLYVLYPGAAPLFLAVLWWALRGQLSNRMRRRGESLLAAAFCLTAVPFLANGLCSVRLRELMPSPDCFFVANAFVLAFAAAAAAQQWLTLSAEQCRTVLPRLAWGVPIYFIGLFGVCLWGLGLRGVPWSATLLHLALPASAALLVTVLLAVTLLRPDPRLMAAGLCLLAAGTQGWLFRHAIAYTPPQEIFPETSFISSLRSLNMRIGGSAGLSGWPLAGNGIPQVYNPSGITLDRYRDFAERMKDDPLLLRRTGARGLLLTREDIQGAFAGIRPVLHIKQVYPAGAVLFEELGAESRARIIHAGRKVEAFDPALLRSDGPAIVEGVFLPEEDKGPPAKATLTESKSYTRVPIQLENPRAGVLVLADAWYPGWVARVDGEERAVRPVDGIFRGVEVKENAREAVFAYQPKPFRFGLSASGFGILVLMAGYVRLLFTRGHGLRNLN